MTPEKTEYRLGLRRSLSVLGLVLPIPLGGLLLPVLLPSEYAIRWSGLSVVLLAGAALVVFQLRAVTTLDPTAITFREVGRPWRLRRTRIPWTEIAAVEARRYGKVVLPVLRLTDGGWVRLRVPAERSYEKIAAPQAELQRWHREHGGLATDQVVVPAAPARPAARRRALVAAGAAGLIAADAVVIGAVFMNAFDRPPERVNCALPPADLIRRIVPDAKVTRPGGGGEVGAAQPGEPCRWEGPQAKDQTAGTTLLLSVGSYIGRFADDDYADDRATDRARHLIHPTPGVRGHTWAVLRSGDVEAKARAAAGGYTIKAELDGAEKDGLTRVEAERQLAELVRAVAARLTKTEARE